MGGADQPGTRFAPGSQALLGKMSEAEQSLAGVTIAYLYRCLTAGSAFFAAARDRPNAGSNMAASIADKDHIEPILLAGMYLDVAVDHYSTVLALFTPPSALPRYTLYTITRGAFEADAWACWLLEPRLPAATRLARALTVRIFNLREVRRFDLWRGRLSPGEDANAKFAARLAQVKEVVRRQGLDELTNQDRELVAVGNHRPKITDVLDALLPETKPWTNGKSVGRHVYGKLSAWAHGDPWTVTQGGLPIARAGSFAALAQVELDVIEYLRLLLVVLKLHNELMRRAGALAGRQLGEWETRRGREVDHPLAVWE